MTDPTDPALHSYITCTGLSSGYSGEGCRGLRDVLIQLSTMPQDNALVMKLVAGLAGDMVQIWNCAGYDWMREPITKILQANIDGRE